MTELTDAISNYLKVFYGVGDSLTSQEAKVVVDVPYFYNLEYGIPLANEPKETENKRGFYNLVDRIQMWMEYKGIEDGKRSIARKIAKNLVEYGPKERHFLQKTYAELDAKVKSGELSIDSFETITKELAEEAAEILKDIIKDDGAVYTGLMVNSIRVEEV